MPRACTVCSNEDRKKIDRELVSGISIRGISRTFRVSEDALSRHRAHVGQAIQRASERREETYEDGLLGKIERIQSKLWALLAKMESEGDHRGAVVALREIRGCLETIDGMMRPEGPQSEQAVLSQLADMAEEVKKERRAKMEAKEHLLAEMRELKNNLRSGLDEAGKSGNAAGFVAFARELRQTLESYSDLAERVVADDY